MQSKAEHLALLAGSMAATLACSWLLKTEDGAIVASCVMIVVTAIKAFTPNYDAQCYVVSVPFYGPLAKQCLENDPPLYNLALLQAVYCVLAFIAFWTRVNASSPPLQEDSHGTKKRRRETD